MFDARKQRVEVYMDTISKCKEIHFLQSSIKASIAGTIIYPAGSDIVIPSQPDKLGNVSVTSERSFEAAMKLHSKYCDKKIAVHNFASATNPGGGVERGSNAQEEALYRCSTLHPCLKTERLWSDYYLFHRKRKDAGYTDTCIYTPGVYVIKSDTNNPQLLPEKEWISVDVITCAAPNLREQPYDIINPSSGNALKVSNNELFEIHKTRAEQILRVAIANKSDCVVLGAFGCGAFCNDPVTVASAYKEIVKAYRNYFDEIVFAVYCSPRDNSNYNVFSKTMSELANR